MRGNAKTASEKPAEEIITRLALHIDYFNKYSHPHSVQMADLAKRMATRLGLVPADIEAIVEAALLHDIGLYEMTPSYLSNPGPLRQEQRMDLWRHSIIGEQAMARRNASRHSQLLVRWHHEWWNGRGYPDRLCFEEIPIGARVLHAVEIYCALIANRPYRPAFTRERAGELLRASAGVQCDPVVITEMLALLHEAGSSELEGPPATEFSRSESREPARILSDSTPTPESIQIPQFTPTYEPGPLHEQLGHPDYARSSEASQPTEYPMTPEYGSSAGVEAREEARPGVAGESGKSEQAFLAEAMGRPEQAMTPAAPGNSEQTGIPAASGNAEQTGVPESPSNAERTGMPAAPSNAEQTGMPAAPGNADQVATPQVTSQPLTESKVAVPEVASQRPESASASKDWLSSHCITGSLLGFQVSVIRQIEFRTVAIPFCGRADLVQYLAALGKHVLSNDSRSWAALAGRVALESEALTDEQVFTILQDTYIPGARMSNTALREWFGEADAWWMDNLRRQALQDPSVQDQALLLGMQAGEYALSFSRSNSELKRPLTAIFRELAANSRAMPATHPHNRAYNLPVGQFLREARADLMYLNLPCGQAEFGGRPSRPAWQDSWLLGHPPANDDFSQLAALPQSKKAYLDVADRILASASRIRKWAVECRDVGLASARDISDLIKTHRTIQATYSKDLTEVSGGLRNYVMIAEAG